MRKPENWWPEATKTTPAKKIWDPLRKGLQVGIPIANGLLVALVPAVLCWTFKNNYSAVCGGSVLLGAAMGDLRQRLHSSLPSSWAQDAGAQAAQATSASRGSSGPSSKLDTISWGHFPYLIAGIVLFLFAWAGVLSHNVVPNDEAQSIISAQSRVLQESEKARKELDEIGLYPVPSPSARRFSDPLVQADVGRQAGQTMQDRMLDAQRECAVEKGLGSASECAQQAWVSSMRNSRAQSAERTKTFFASTQWERVLAAQRQLKALTNQTLREHAELSSGASLGGVSQNLAQWRLADPMSERVRLANETVEALRARALMGFIAPAGYAGSRSRAPEPEQELKDQAGISTEQSTTLPPTTRSVGHLRPVRPSRVQAQQEHEQEINQRFSAGAIHPQRPALSEAEIKEQHEKDRLNDSIINGNIAALTGMAVGSDVLPALSSSPPEDISAKAETSVSIH